MACGSASSGLVNRNGPGSAATSIIDSIVKPAEATGGKTKCIDAKFSSVWIWALGAGAISDAVDD
ncbi:hypothetical protein CORC01_12479 [Colletotrichum orchidophilum]|uniref:Uncharacterized protein n=1 Tax=Colletotrichum orchidophilum TaxID=1209926 RepID=A0A1G4AT29_9PEZI|nr:uncharacterized protein CORC01_12479 [Colletotrichum orchidophilum]OHE92243.1 hypothetical protein CORC01_12479 [Colletotrichum orchidophilum]